MSDVRRVEGDIVITIIHGGQTGVDRGAHNGALLAGLAIAGFMPNSGRDEYGLIPGYVAKYLQHYGTVSERTALNVASADIVVIVAAFGRIATPGTRLTESLASQSGKPTLILGESALGSTIWYWIKSAAMSGEDLRVMIAGPRASLWPNGASAARRLVMELGACAR